MVDFEAKHLIIGGGIIGCSIAYHLTRNGEKDVVLLERAALTEGATWHAAGLVGQLRSSRNTTRMLKKSVEMYDRLQSQDGVSFDWKKTGSLRLAANNERLLEAKRLATMAQSFGLEMSIIGPSDAKELFPLIEEKEIDLSQIKDEPLILLDLPLSREYFLSIFFIIFYYHKKFDSK